MSVVVEKPYAFVPPHRGELWPTLIQRFRFVDFYLRKKEGVVSYECRNLDRLRASIQANYGILLAPNHCRYADPLALGWLSRELGRHVFAMASWHLFNKSWFDRFSIPKMGGFSIFREGLDRQSIEMAIDILDKAPRPLIVFPEGTTNRCNDCLQPLLDGVTFMARTAAKRRAKREAGPVVIHPVGIKYLFRGNIAEVAESALKPLEARLTWNHSRGLSLVERTVNVVEGLLSLKEIEYLGHVGYGELQERRHRLIERLLQPIETLYLGNTYSGDPVLNRVRACRAKIVPKLLENGTSEEEKVVLRRQAVEIDLAQKLISYPDDYLNPEKLTDTRLLETLERMHEDLFGKSFNPTPLHVVMDVGEPIEVPDGRTPRGEADPVIDALRDKLAAMLQSLALEARPLRQ